MFIRNLKGLSLQIAPLLILIFVFINAGAQRYRWSFNVLDTPVVTGMDIYAHLHADNRLFVMSDIDRRGYFFSRFPSSGTTKLNLGSVELPGLYKIKIVDTTFTDTVAIKSNVYHYLIYPSPVNTRVMKRSLIEPERQITDRNTFMSLLNEVFIPNMEKINKKMDSVMWSNYDSASLFACKIDSAQTDSLRYVVFFTPEDPALIITIENEDTLCEDPRSLDLIFSLMNETIKASGIPEDPLSVYNDLLNGIRARREFRTVCVKNIYKYLIGSYFGLDDQKLCNKTSLYYNNNVYFKQCILLVNIKKKAEIKTK